MEGGDNVVIPTPLPCILLSRRCAYSWVPGGAAAPSSNCVWVRCSCLEGAAVTGAHWSTNGGCDPVEDAAVPALPVLRLLMGGWSACAPGDLSLLSPGGSGVPRLETTRRGGPSSHTLFRRTHLSQGLLSLHCTWDFRQWTHACLTCTRVGILDLLLRFLG